jgi:type III secretion protein Q
MDTVRRTDAASYVGAPAIKNIPRARWIRRTLTRAHLALSRRPSFSRQAHEALQKVAEALSEQLSLPVTARAQLLPTVFQPPRLGQESAVAVFELSAVEGTAALEVELPLLGMLLSAVSGTQVSLVPGLALGKIVEATFGYLALVALQASRGPAEAQLAARLLSVGKGEWAAQQLPSNAYLGIRLNISLGEQSGTAWLYLPSRSLAMALLLSPEELGHEMPRELQNLSLSGRLSLNACHLTHAEIQTLAPRDVVVIPELSLDQGRLEGYGVIAFASFELHGRFLSQGFQFQDSRPRPLSRELFMNPQVVPDDRSAVSVELSIELSRVSLPLSELAALKPGGILPLHLHVAEPVVLRVGDRPIARAELVDIEGSVGARILGLLP